MTDWKTILVPTDFSEGSRAALTMAGEIATRHGARVILLHVIDLPPGLDPGSMVRPEGSAVSIPLVDMAREQALAWMEKDRVTHLAKTEDVTVRVELGSPVVQTVLDVAQSVGADLIVVGTHGRTGLAHMVLGSVAEKIVRMADAPVLSVRRSRGSNA
ncbi:MAG: universal stress protein [Deltaproteobacteria bacterium]|nr:universal stress protein [Deltaproteobacteria bacterium]